MGRWAHPRLKRRKVGPEHENRAIESLSKGKTQPRSSSAGRCRTTSSVIREPTATPSLSTTIGWRKPKSWMLDATLSTAWSLMLRAFSHSALAYRPATFRSSLDSDSFRPSYLKLRLFTRARPTVSRLWFPGGFTRPYPKAQEFSLANGEADLIYRSAGPSTTETRVHVATTIVAQIRTIYRPATCKPVKRRLKRSKSLSPWLNCTAEMTHQLSSTHKLESLCRSRLANAPRDDCSRPQ
jgi:hypothetical protein